MALYLDDVERTDQNMKVLVDYFRTFDERNKFNGFAEVNGFKKDSTEHFIQSYLRENLVGDIFYETLVNGETQMFEIFREFTLEFEHDLLINYLKQNEFEKFETLIKRFLVLSKEPVKSNVYYILLNCLFWTNEEDETIFNYIIENEINAQNENHHRAMYCSYYNELLFSLNGIYLKKSENSFLKISKDLEEKLEKEDIDIYKTKLKKTQHGMPCYDYIKKEYAERQAML